MKKHLPYFGYRVAQGDKWPEWKPGTEFKAKREAQRLALGTHRFQRAGLASDGRGPEENLRHHHVSSHARTLEAVRTQNSIRQFHSS
ncbi:MAG: hypothetical protein HYR56_23350 [Acidobacteria bacterium]|nr:hypothetical protein [Acidobacteriota bacterium]MBI3425473.1 hypothetical protein [Acidobacteriota bacterium]